MRYLITGGAGFVGSHATEALVARGDTVTILDNLSTGDVANVEHLLDSGRVSFVEGSVTDAALVDRLMRRADRCLHLASAVGVELVVEQPLETLLENVRGIDVVLESAARHNCRLLFTSTSEVYGKRSGVGLTEDSDLTIGSPAKSRWSYAIAKQFGEAVAAGYHAQGAEVIVVRLFNAVGPRQSARYGMVLPRFVIQALAGEDLTVHGDGSQTRCFTHVRDSVGAILALFESDGALGRTFNVGSAVPIAVADLAARVIERTRSSSRVVYVPVDEAYAPGFEELGIRQPDVSALRDLTGWERRYGLDDAIDDVIAHFRSQAESDLLANAA